MRKQSNDIIWIDLDVDGKPLKMELDTGSAVLIIAFDLYQQKFWPLPAEILTSTSRNFDLYQQKFIRLPLHKTRLSLKTYTEENIMPVWVLKVPVDNQTQRELLDLYVVGAT